MNVHVDTAELNSRHEISPPEGTSLADQEKLLANVYEPVPINGKAPRWDDWNKGAITPERLEKVRRAHPDHLGTGLRCGRLVGADNDLRNPEHAARIDKIVERVLGWTSFQRFGSKGMMHCYRNESPIARVKVVSRKPGAQYKADTLFEFIGRGGQIAAFGNHPETKQPFRWVNDWEGADPLQTPLSALPEITPAMIQECAEAIAAECRRLGYPNVSVTGFGSKDPGVVSQRDGEPAALETVWKALDYIDGDIDYHIWRDIGWALKALKIMDGDRELSDAEKLALYKAWSRTGRQKFNDGRTSCETVWRTDKGASDTEGRIGPGTLFYYARLATCLLSDFEAAGMSPGSSDTTPAIAAFIEGLQRQEGKQPKRKGRMSKTAAEMAHGKFKDTSYLISDLVLERQVNMLWGDGGAGKTLLQVNKAVAVAAGIPLFEGEPNLCAQVKPMPVLIVLTEDTFRVTQDRLKSICHTRGLNLTDLAINTFCTADPGEDEVSQECAAPIDTQICTIDENGKIIPGPFLLPLLEEIEAVKGEEGLYVILDARMDFADFNDNWSAPVNAFTKRVLRGICQVTGATIDLTAHPSRKAMETGTTTGGSVQWRNSVRNTIGFEREKPKEPEDPYRILTFSKNNTAKDKAGRRLRLNDDFTFTPVSDLDNLLEAENRYKAVVDLALECARKGQPLNSRKLKIWQRERLQAILPGTTLTETVVKNELSLAVDKGDLSVVATSRHKLAGYYPADPILAAELAAFAKKMTKQTEQEAAESTKH